MYSALSALIGVVIALMVEINGHLSAWYGVLSAAVIIHIVGCVFAAGCLAVSARRLRLRGRGIPGWMYLGGVIGYFTTFFNSFSFGTLSVTAIVALGLLGQMAASALIDALGLCGMPRVPFRPAALAGFFFSGLGVAVMLWGARGGTLYAVAASFGAGVTIVLSRTVNAGLSARIGSMEGSLVNHLTGLPVAAAALALFGRSEALFTSSAPLSPQAWIYLGGTLGVTVVCLCNLTVPRVSALRFTLLSFVGQVLTGLLIDLASGRTGTPAMLTGALLVAAGVAANTLLEQLPRSAGQ